MKQINYLSIQGSQAPAFWFKNQDAQNFRSLIEAISHGNALVVSSIYRSDVFFITEKDHLDLVIKTWCILKEQAYNEQTRGKFIRAANSHDAFEFYFDTLFHLMLHPAHYERYKKNLNEIRKLEPNHQILSDLTACDMHLADCYREQHVQYRRLLDGKTPDNAPLAWKGFRTLAQKRLKMLHYN